MATASHMFPFMLTLPDGTLHDAVRIYGETLEAVAEWCGGEVGGAAIPGKGTVAGILYPTGKGHDAFAPYIANGRRVTSRKSSRRSSSASTGRAQRQKTAEIRAWAIEKGYTSSTRGRLGPTIIEAYEAAHQNAEAQ